MSLERERAEPVLAGPDRPLVVLGAFGRTGWRLIAEARRRGWTVLAADRKPDSAQGIRRLDAAFLDGIRGLDAPILSALGPVPGEPGTEIGDLLARILADGRGVRVVWILGAAISQPGDDRGWLYAAMTRILEVRRDPAWVEKTRELALLRASSARWTAVRPPRLTDEEPAGRYDDDRPRLRARSRISRSTLARFMLDCVERDLHVREAPLVVGV